MAAVGADVRRLVPRWVSQMVAVITLAAPSSALSGVSRLDESVMAFGDPRRALLCLQQLTESSHAPVDHVLVREVDERDRAGVAQSTYGGASYLVDRPSCSAVGVSNVLSELLSCSSTDSNEMYGLV